MDALAHNVLLLNIALLGIHEVLRILSQIANTPFLFVTAFLLPQKTGFADGI
jgi:hypothetical protein